MAEGESRVVEDRCMDSLVVVVVDAGMRIVVEVVAHKDSVGFGSAHRRCRNSIQQLPSR